MKSMEDYLNLYPPGKDTAQDKVRGEKRKPSNSPGRKTLEKMDAQSTLDIHGHTEEEGKGEVLSFIAQCRKRGIRKGLIIHGKGLHSPDGAVLRPMVRRVLEKHPHVRSWGKSTRRNGGDGATWFVL